MKVISLRDFQLNANKFLAEGDFPILLTRYKIVVAQVIPNGKGDISQEQLDEVYEKVAAKKIKEPLTVERKMGYCNYPYCEKPAVKERDGRFWCEDHL